jgi:hypothetical protein
MGIQKELMNEVDLLIRRHNGIDDEFKDTLSLILSANDPVALTRIRVFNPSLSFKHQHIVKIDEAKGKVPVLFNMQMQPLVTQTMTNNTWDVYKSQIKEDTLREMLYFSIDDFSPLAMLSYFLVEFESPEQCAASLMKIDLDVKHCQV